MTSVKKTLKHSGDLDYLKVAHLLIELAMSRLISALQMKG